MKHYTYIDKQAFDRILSLAYHMEESDLREALFQCNNLKQQKLSRKQFREFCELLVDNIVRQLTQEE